MTERKRKGVRERGERDWKQDLLLTVQFLKALLSIPMISCLANSNNRKTLKLHSEHMLPFGIISMLKISVGKSPFPKSLATAILFIAFWLLWLPQVSRVVCYLSFCNSFTSHSTTFIKLILVVIYVDFFFFLSCICHCVYMPCFTYSFLP